MTVTEESGGRLNAFAKEPEIQVISSKQSNSYGFQGFLLILAVLCIGIIGFYLINK